ncbi:MAG: ThuA domain-containing protein [Planctomycetota bacterium]
MLRTALFAAALAAPMFAQDPSTQKHPVPEDPRWLVYPAADAAQGPGKGAHVVFVAGEQEYRAEQALPMLARLLSTRHGFHCTVLFTLKDGKVDPTQKTRPDDPQMFHELPGLEHLASADLLVLFTRFLTLHDEDLAHLNRYLDSGKPLIGIRTANHGFQGNWTYEVDGKKVRFGDDVLGGTFRGHHGGWHREATRGVIVEANAAHPVLTGVKDVFGPTDVYRTYPEGKGLPEGCTALLLGQPLQSLEHDAEPNKDKEALPVAWVKTWTGNGGKTARVFHLTMGSARDFECADLRRLFLNATLWGLGREAAIDAKASVELVGPYEPLHSGFDYENLGVKPHEPAYYR